MLRARLATAAVALPLIVWLIFRGPIWMIASVVLVFTVLGLGEFFSIVFPERRVAQVLGVVSGTLVAVAMALESPEARAGSPGLPFTALVVVFLLGLVGTLSRADEPEEALRDLAVTLLGVVYVGALLPHLIWLRADTGEAGPGWLFLVIAVGMAGDTAGYFAGRQWGRRPLMPKVSPKKTVEGALGAIGGNLVAGAITKVLFLPHVPWGVMLGVAAVAGVLAQVGDLCESLLKRAFHAKDSGFLLPGHGGVLDRMDSLVFPSVFIYHTAVSLSGIG